MLLKLLAAFPANTPGVARLATSSKPALSLLLFPATAACLSAVGFKRWRRR